MTFGNPFGKGNVNGTWLREVQKLRPWETVGAVQAELAATTLNDGASDTLLLIAGTLEVGISDSSAVELLFVHP